MIVVDTSAIMSLYPDLRFFRTCDRRAKPASLKNSIGFVLFLLR